VTDRVRLLVAEVEAEIAQAELPPDLAARVKRAQARDPALCWDEALERALADVTPDAA
jgi:hypothetical protein